MIKRLFIAVDVRPEPELGDFFQNLKEQFEGEQIKWVGGKIFHLTLKFLGDTETGRIVAVKSVLASVAAEFPPFNCKVKGIGYFGSKNDPRIIYAGIEGGDELKEISRRVNGRLFEDGFEKESKNFNAHLTLGRIKSVRDKQGFFEFIKTNENSFFQSLKVSEIVLYESILRPQGPEYIPVAKFRLRTQG